VFTEELLRPESQDLATFVDGIDNIVSTQKRVAWMYFGDGSVAQACPPLKALLHIMAHDSWEGKALEHPDVRRLFTLDSLLSSDWYAARLKARQTVERKLLRRHCDYLDRFLKNPSYSEEAQRLGIAARLQRARKALDEIDSPTALEKLSGTLGTEPIEKYLIRSA
jgi:hypothetical protein